MHMLEKESYSGQFLAITLVIILAIAIYGVSALMRGLASEGYISEVYGVFTLVGERAIQLDRFGRTFAVRSNSNQIRLPKRFSDDPSQISCADHIDTISTNMKDTRGVRVIMPIRKTSPAYIIYTGRAPDFSKILNNENARSYFASQKEYYLGEKADSFDDPDEGYLYDAYIKNRSFSWHSYECPTFTYTVITEE